jgi:hypothetical protein
VHERFETGADQVALNLVADDASALPLEELRRLAPLTQRRRRSGGAITDAGS